MKNRTIFVLAAALIFSLVSQDRDLAENTRLSMLIPTLGIKCEEIETDEKLVILDGDDEEVEYGFKLGEIFRKLFD